MHHRTSVPLFGTMVVPLLLALRGMGVAAEPARPPSSGGNNADAIEARAGEERNGWDLWHENISQAFTTPFEKLDLFFADDILYEEEETSRLHLKLGMKAQSEGGLSIMTDARVHLVLPRTENRLHLFFEDEFAVDDADKGDFAAKASEQSMPDIGLRLSIKKEPHTSLGMHFGARLADPAQGFARLRGRYTLPAGPWELRLSQSVAWFTEDQWTETSEMRWSLPLTEETQFRSVSRLTWGDKDSGVTPDQSLQLLSQISPRAGLRFSVDGSWPGVPQVEEDLYTISLAYRRSLYRKWLFLEVTPGVEFPQERHHEANRFLTAQFEVIFGG